MNVKAALAGLILVAVALTGCSSNNSSSSASTTTAASRRRTTPTDGNLNNWSDIPDVAQRVAPSIVTILAGNSLGSGVVFQPDVIATAAHVLGTEKSVKIVLADGKSADGTVIATDPVTDVGAVRSSRAGLPVAKFDESLPDLGDLAIAVGSPLGFTSSVTSGVISGLGRSIPGTAGQTQSLVDLIQTDAAISPGNSGGGIVDGDGQVLGLAEAYIPPSEGAVSIGFAIPAHTVTDVMNQLLQKGTVSHPYLGVSAVPITSDIQQQLGLQQGTGALIQEVGAGSPAANAGIQPGDVITNVDNATINNPEDLIAAIRSHNPGDTVQITFVRDNVPHTVTVTLTDRPTQ